MITIISGEKYISGKVYKNVTFACTSLCACTQCYIFVYYVRIFNSIEIRIIYHQTSIIHLPRTVYRIPISYILAEKQQNQKVYKNVTIAKNQPNLRGVKYPAGIKTLATTFSCVQLLCMNVIMQYVYTSVNSIQIHHDSIVSDKNEDHQKVSCLLGPKSQSTGQKWLIFSQIQTISGHYFCNCDVFTNTSESLI